MTTSQTNRSIVPVGGDLDQVSVEEWRDIVNNLVEQIDDDVPEDVVRATELMLSGMPYHEVSKEIGVTTATIKSWVRRYPAISEILSQGRRLLSKWRLARLEQQYLTAIEKSKEILNMELYEDPEPEEDSELPKGPKPKRVNVKLAGVVAQHARFVIDQFTKVNNEISLKSDGESITMNASGDALAYIAREMSRHRDEHEPIEATFRVIDENSDKAQIPILDSHGNPFYGEMGKLDVTEDGAMCHVCGKRYKALASHLTILHVLPVDVYELTFMLDEGTVKDADSKGT